MKYYLKYITIYRTELNHPMEKEWLYETNIQYRDDLDKWHNSLRLIDHTKIDFNQLNKQLLSKKGINIRKPIIDITDLVEMKTYYDDDNNPIKSFLVLKEVHDDNYNKITESEKIISNTNTIKSDLREIYKRYNGSHYITMLDAIEEYISNKEINKFLNQNNDAIEFAEWIRNERIVESVSQNMWLIIKDDDIVKRYTTKQLYEIFKTEKNIA
jgi:hypothetical protein